ncbi:MAG: HD domain-containing phosphohydrolase [Pseudomonadota bacterium]
MNKKILLIDDELDVLFLLRKILESDNYQLESAMNAKEGLEKALSFKPDLILLDIMLPEKSGFDFFQDLKKNKILNKKPIIFLSAKSDSESKLKGLNLGAIDYITKPFNSRELLVRIHNFFKITRLEQDLIKANKNLHKTYMNTIYGLGIAVEMNDPTTNGHCKRVSELAEKIGQNLGLKGKELEFLKIAAILHDLGKVAIPSEILNKKGSLTKIEFEIIKTHTVMGAQILESMKFSPKIVKGVLHHHEMHDGSGYPKGLSKNKIPLFAKIISVVDAYDAITTKRPYKKARSKINAYKEINKLSGKLYDPIVVDAFNEVIKNMK